MGTVVGFAHSSHDRQPNVTPQIDGTVPDRLSSSRAIFNVDDTSPAALIADDPGVYFTTPHFDGYPAVLVRLAEIGEAELNELITEAWLAQAPKSLAKAFLQNGD